MFVSESKFQSKPSDFIPHIIKANSISPPPQESLEALEKLIYKPEVETALLRRLEKKAMIYCGEFDIDGNLIVNDGRVGIGKISVKGVVKLYEDWVIPLTKKVEVSKRNRYFHQTHGSG
jgi:chorismate mutase